MAIKIMHSRTYLFQVDTVDVDCSFYIYKNLLPTKLRTFEFENMKKSLIKQYNNF